MTITKTSAEQNRAQNRYRKTILLGCTALAALTPAQLLAQDANASVNGSARATVLETIVVEGTNTGRSGESQKGGIKTEGYVAKTARIGTKTDTDLKKVPQSISTVSRKELDDRGVKDLVEAVKYSAGVQTGVYGFDPRFDTVYIRGFNVGSTGFYRDGLREVAGTFARPRMEPYGVEGVTILKGPSSVLYGAGSPGGIVNIVSKRPTDEPFHEVEGQIGSFNRYQGAFDFSGPVAGNDNVLYRLTGLARNADTQFVAAKDDRVFIAPAVTFRSDDRDTQLTVLGEYTNLTSGGAAGYSPGIDFETGDPAYGDLDHIQKRIGYEFEHRFNENVAFRQNLRYSKIDTDMKWVEYDTATASPPGTIARTANRIAEYADTFNIDSHFEFDFATGSLQHTMIAGVDFVDAKSDYAYGSGPAPAFDTINPNFGSQPISGPTSFLMHTSSKMRQLGVYLQDQIEVNNFILTAGGRYDWVDMPGRDLINGTSTEQEDGKFTGRAGLSYLFDNGFAPYVSYATSFAPTPGFTTSGEAYKPTEGEQYEVGLKYAPSDINLSFNAALFDLTQKNVTVSLGNGTSFQRGEVQSRGLELEAKTNLDNGIDLTAGYTYLDMEIVGGVNDGNQPLGIPRNQFSLWANYEFMSGFAEGLMVGAGVKWAGKTWISDTNLTKNDVLVTVDAALSYDFGKASPQLAGLVGKVNVTNIFNEKGERCADSYCYVEQERSVVGSLRYRF